MTLTKHKRRIKTTSSKCNYCGVNNVKQTAQELNNAMTQLKQGIADKEQTKADGNFVNADPDKQNAYKQAVAKAEALISGTPDVVVTPSEITAALNKVTQAKMI